MSDVSRVAEELCGEFGDQVSSQAIVFAVTGARRALLTSGEGDDMDLLRNRSREVVIDLIDRTKERAPAF